MKKRLFLAISLPDSLLQLFVDFKNKYIREEGIRWTPRQNLHSTVYFFGAVEEKDIAAFRERLRQVVANTSPFSLHFEKIIFAPPHHPPRMIWAEFSPNPRYEKLVKNISLATQEFLDPQSAQEMNRKPVPHVTIARFHDSHIAKNIQLPHLKKQMINITSCDLMASELTPKGSIYTILETYEIG